MAALVQFSHVVRTFGATCALDDVTFSVPEGSVCALLGPNGAGKTTALRILLGLARPSSGRVEACGAEPGALSVRHTIGYLPDVPAFPAWMTAAEYLHSVAELNAITTDAATPRIHTLLDMAGLSDVRQGIGGYSRGMKQRLGLAQALMNSPKLLILDEPTSALDPAGKREVLDLITQLAGHATILLSSHNLAEVQHVCSDAVVLQSGRVLFSGSLDTLRQRTGGHSLRIETDKVSELDTLLHAEPWCTASHRERGAVVVTLSDPDAAARRIPLLIAKLGGALGALIPEEVSLEDAFLTLTAATTQEGAR